VRLTHDWTQGKPQGCEEAPAIPEEERGWEEAVLRRVAARIRTLAVALEVAVETPPEMPPEGVVAAREESAWPWLWRWLAWMSETRL